MLPQYQFKMATPLATCTKEEQRSVICFLNSEGLKPIEVRQQMKVQYGDVCLSLQQVYEWSRKFRNGVTFVTDALCLGQAHHVVAPVYCSSWGHCDGKSPWDNRSGVFNPWPTGHLQPSGEFCAAREGYFTKYNALWILKLESLDTNVLYMTKGK